MANPRILLLGATGTLGGPLGIALAQRYSVFAPKPRDPRSVPERSAISWLPTIVEATQEAGLDRLVAEARPNTIINCIAVTPTRGCCDDPVACVAVNSLFPHRLARASRNLGCHLIHISTDGVFSGKRGNYSEDDLPDPPDLYGRSKLAGEVSEAGCLTLRTTYFGPSATGRGLVQWLLNQRNGRINGFTGYKFSGLSTAALSNAIIAMLGQDNWLTGVYHVGGPAVTKYELLAMLSRRLHLGITIDPIALPAVDRTLDSRRFWTAIGRATPSIEQMVEDVYLDLSAPN